MSVSLEIFAPVVAILGLLWSLVFWKEVNAASDGTPAMQKVAAAISKGANAFVKRQYKTITWLAIVVGASITVIYGLSGGSDWWVKGYEVGGSFLLGAFLSGLSGIVSMIVATRANLKTADAAQRGLNDALKMALSGGTVSAIVITALSLLGISGLYILYRFGLGRAVETIPALIVGYGFGASFVALFAQLGGGIYTK